jgi:hypothetical protein
MHLSNSPSGAVLTLSGLKPGDQNGGTVDITNDGSIDATSLSVSRTNLIDKDGTAGHNVCNNTTNICASLLSQKLNLVVYDCGDFTTSAPSCPADGTIAATDPNSDTNVKYKGTLADFGSAQPLGALAQGHSHRYRFVATFDSSADSTYRSEQSQADFEWNSAQ